MPTVSPYCLLAPQISHHSFYQALRIAPDQHPLMVTEPPLNLMSKKEKTSQVRGQVVGGRAGEGGGSGLPSLGVPSGHRLFAERDASPGEICPL